MDKPYREADPPKLTPGKIIQIATSDYRLYGLDENGVVWYAQSATNADARRLGQYLTPWRLAVGIHTPPT